MEDDNFFDDDLIGEFVDDVDYKLNNLEDLITTLSKEPENKDVIEEMYRLLHTIKGTSSIFGFMKIRGLTHVMEDVLGSIRAGNLTVNKNFVHDFLFALDYLKDLLTSIQQERKELDDESSHKICLDKISSYSDTTGKKES